MLRRSAIPALGAVLGLAVATAWVVPAHAAEETEITPFLHFRGGVGYRGQFIQGQYVRDDVRVGAREEERQFTDIEARFGAWYGLETYLLFSHDNWDRVRWQGVDFDGFGGPEDHVERRKGITDIVVGVKYAVLAEARKTGDVSTWTVETNFKIPGSFEVYPVLDDPATAEAPAGSPGFEWLIKTSFSKRIRFLDPYVTFYYVNRGTASAPSEGVEEFNLADMWGTYFGTEIVGFERPADNLRFSADASVGWRYIIEGEVPANRFLYGPDSGAATSPPGNVVTEQGYVRYDARVGFYYQLHRRFQARGHLTYGLPTEHYIEAYPSSFNDTSRNGARVRNKEFTDFGFNFSVRWYL